MDCSNLPGTLQVHICCSFLFFSFWKGWNFYVPDERPQFYFEFFLI